MSLKQPESGSKLSLQLGLAPSSGVSLVVSCSDPPSEYVFKVPYEAKWTLLSYQWNYKREFHPSSWFCYETFNWTLPWKIKTHDHAASPPVDGKTAPSGDKRDSGDSSSHIFICQKQWVTAASLLLRLFRWFNLKNIAWRSPWCSCAARSDDVLFIPTLGKFTVRKLK